MTEKEYRATLRLSQKTPEQQRAAEYIMKRGEGKEHKLSINEYVTAAIIAYEETRLPITEESLYKNIKKAMQEVIEKVPDSNEKESEPQKKQPSIFEDFNLDVSAEEESNEELSKASSDFISSTSI